MYVLSKSESYRLIHVYLNIYIADEVLELIVKKMDYT